MNLQGSGLDSGAQPVDDQPSVPTDSTVPLSSDQEPQTDENYRVVLNPLSVSLRGDGKDSATLIPTIISSTGRDATAESTFLFEKLSDIGDTAAVLSPGAAAATVFAQLLLNGDVQQFPVRCKATVPTPNGPVTVESDSVTVEVRPANPQFILQIPQDALGSV